MFKKVGIYEYVCDDLILAGIFLVSLRTLVMPFRQRYMSVVHRYKRHRCVQACLEVGLFESSTAPAHIICRSKEITLEDVQYRPNKQAPTRQSRQKGEIFFRFSLQTLTLQCLCHFS
jgi:hypothetical protein